MKCARTPPRVLAIADRSGWAIERKTQNLARTLAGRFDVVTRFQEEVAEADLDRADIVLVYYWLEILKMPIPDSVLERRRDRLLTGICSHLELEGDRRERGLATLRRLPRAVFVNSRGLERAFGPLLEQPVYYTPNGVDTTFFSPAPEPVERRAGVLRVGWAGSLTNHGPAHRGFHDIIEPAVAAVPGATLLTAIREQHWRARDEMLHFYRGLDVYVCASLSEGTPNPCLEAAACGVPLVTTPVGNMPDLVRDGEDGFFVERRVEDLVEKLTLLRDSPELAARLAGRMRESIAAWDWRIQAERYARMFDDLLEQAPPARRAKRVAPRAQGARQRSSQ